MARERQEREHGHEEGRRGQARKSPTGMFGLAIVLVAVGAAVGLFLLTNKEKAKPNAAAPEATAEPANPFADVPPEKPPEKQAPTKEQK
jgi:hypothetical protein